MIDYRSYHTSPIFISSKEGTDFDGLSFKTTRNTYKYKNKMSGSKLMSTILTRTTTAPGRTTTTTENTKVEYSNWKQVSKIRNCDAFGNTVPLGYNGFGTPDFYYDYDDE